MKKQLLLLSVLVVLSSSLVNADTLIGTQPVIESVLRTPRDEVVHKSRFGNFYYKRMDGKKVYLYHLNTADWVQDFTVYHNKINIPSGYYEIRKFSDGHFRSNDPLLAEFEAFHHTYGWEHGYRYIVHYALLHRKNTLSTWKLYDSAYIQLNIQQFFDAITLKYDLEQARSYGRGSSDD